MRNDSYLPGALVLAYALKMQTNLDCVCLVTENISKSACHALHVLYDKVITTDELKFENVVKGGRSDRKNLPTRFQALRLCENGGLGAAYDKIILLDADVLPLHNYDALFALNTPAGIIMENKTACYSSGIQDSAKWSWHALYEPTCPHGLKIPYALTDRVRTDPLNMGVNSGLWVLRPSMDEFNEVSEAMNNPEILNLLEKFPWPEMQLATLLWSGRWTNVDIRYCSIGGYPKPDVLFGMHFAGVKPWQIKHRSITHYARFPDFLLWYEFFNAMYWSHSELREISSLKKICEFINPRLRI